jgi:multiple sugar transport system substrate-binding protein
MRTGSIRVALVGGPMYDSLYSLIPQFERDTGIEVEVVVRLPHPALNAWVTRAFGGGEPDIDLLSTHTKYAPSQVQWLSPLDSIVGDDDRRDLLSGPLAFARIDGRLFQMPRNLDVRLLHYRSDLLDAAPETWSALADAAQRVTTESVAGFLFPGRDSGLFGMFYELLVSAGGQLFDDSLRPVFQSPEGIAAVAYIKDLHLTRRVTPRALTDWHYDEISAAFRDGRAAMVSDWPGSYHLYKSPATCRVADRVRLAMLPLGSSGIRAAYAGCHSFGIPRSARNPEGGVALMRYLTSFEAQLGEARAGAIPCRVSAIARIREEASGDSVEASRWEMLAETEKIMIMPPRFAAYPHCEDAIWRSVQRAMLGEISPEQAVARAVTDVRALVEGVRPGSDPSRTLVL